MGKHRDFPYSLLTRRFRVDANQRRALNILETKTLLKNNRFKIRLLSRKENTALPYSRDLAVKRLMSSEKSFSKIQTFKEMCKPQINEYVDQSCGKKLSKNEASIASQVTKYTHLTMTLSM